jgi:hypothetical protein
MGFVVVVEIARNMTRIVLSGEDCGLRIKCDLPEKFLRGFS